MIQLAILLVFMIITLCICSAVTNNAILSPQIAFTASFIPGIIYAFFYVKKWNLYLLDTTVLVLIIGVATFAIFSVLTVAVGKKLGLLIPKKTKWRLAQRKGNINDYIPSWKITFLIAFEAITLILTIAFLIRNYGKDLSSAIFAYRVSTSGEDSIPIPSTIKLMRRICVAAGFFVAYLLVHGYVYRNKRNRIHEIVCVVLSALNGLNLGGRGDLIQLIFATIIMLFIIRKQKSGKNLRAIKFRDWIKIMVVIIIIIVTFSGIGTLLGRQMDFLNFSDYIAVYLSAELKNLDLFIRQGQFSADMSSYQTLAYVINLIAKPCGHPEWIHELYIPYNYINGYALGNVRTVFYPFMYDGGFATLIIFTALMSIITQILFNRAMVSHVEKEINLTVIAYSYVWFTIAFSFFSAKFYEMIFNTVFIYTVITWVVLKCFFEKEIKLVK